MKAHSKEYDDYIASDKWHEVAQTIKKRDNFTCQTCGSRERLEVHHIRYKYLTKELDYPETVVTLCNGCHQKIHRYFDVVEALEAHYRKARNVYA